MLVIQYVTFMMKIITLRKINELSSNKLFLNLLLSIKFLSPPPSLAKIVKKYRWTTFLKRGGGWLVGWLLFTE